MFDLVTVVIIKIFFIVYLVLCVNVRMVDLSMLIFLGDIFDGFSRFVSFRCSKESRLIFLWLVMAMRVLYSFFLLFFLLLILILF